MPPRHFIGKEIVRLIFLNRSAERCASLHPGIGRVGTRRIEAHSERIDGLKIAIAQISVGVAVEVVRSGAGDNVDHAAGGAAIFGGVAVADDLEFLYVFLRNRGAHAIGGVVGSVGAIDVDQVGTGALAAHVEAGGGRGASVGSVVARDLRIGERELNVIAAVDRQIIDAALADRVGGGTARSFDEFGLRADFDDFLAARNGERDRQLNDSANGDGHAVGLSFGKARCLDRDGIHARRQLPRTVAALAVAGGGAFQSLGGISNRHGGVGHHAALRIFHDNVEVAGSGALGKGRLTGE